MTTQTPKTNIADYCKERGYIGCEKVLIAELSTANARIAAQSAELTAIDEAIGTNEGHSAVTHILALKARIARLRKLTKQYFEAKTLYLEMIHEDCIPTEDVDKQQSTYLAAEKALRAELEKNDD